MVDLRDFEKLVKDKNPIPLLPWAKDYLHDSKLNEYLKKVESEYKEKYSNTDKYVEYTLDENGNKVYPDEYYVVDYDNTDAEPKLKDEILELIKEGKERPNYDFYINSKVEEFEKTYTLDENELKEFLKPYYMDMIQAMADEKQESAENTIADKNNITEKQIDRYKTKALLAQKAKNGDKNAEALLEVEANISGVSVDDLIDTIIEKANEWETAITNYKMMIESFRILAQRTYDIDFRKSLEAIKDPMLKNSLITDEELTKLKNKYFPNL